MRVESLDWIVAPGLVSSVILDKLIYFSEPQFPYWKQYGNALGVAVKTGGKKCKAPSRGQ